MSERESWWVDRDDDKVHRYYCVVAPGDRVVADHLSIEEARQIAALPELLELAMGVADRASPEPMRVLADIALRKAGLR